MTLGASQWRQWNDSGRQAVPDSWHCGSEGTVANGRATYRKNNQRIGHRWPQVPTWSAIQRHWHPMFNIHHLCSAHAVTLIISDTVLLAFTCADGTERWYSGTGCLCLLHSESNTVHRMTTSPLVWKWFGCKGQSQGYMARKCPSLKLPNALRHLINIC